MWILAWCRKFIDKCCLNVFECLANCYLIVVSFVTPGTDPGFGEGGWMTRWTRCDYKLFATPTIVETTPPDHLNVQHWKAGWSLGMRLLDLVSVYHKSDHNLEASSSKSNLSSRLEASSSKSNLLQLIPSSHTVNLYEKTSRRPGWFWWCNGRGLWWSTSEWITIEQPHLTVNMSRGQLLNYYSFQCASSQTTSIVSPKTTRPSRLPISLVNQVPNYQLRYYNNVYQYNDR